MQAVGWQQKMSVDRAGVHRNLLSPFPIMSSTEPKQQSLTPEQIPFTSPQLMSRYITDTGKILPRKYTGMTAKQQRKVTSTIKNARKMLVMK